MPVPLHHPESFYPGGKDGSFSDKAIKLLANQKKSWDLLRKNYELLDQVKTREFHFDHFTIKAQFNPSRITSSSARIEPEFIAARTCFLCSENLPEQQEKLEIDRDFILLCNPYPIFREHFTILTKAHVPQEIKPNFSNLLTLSKILNGHILFYNGPYCGASAPDHFHFQAGNKSYLPIEKQLNPLKDETKGPWFSNEKIRIWGVEQYPGRFILFESSSIPSLVAAFDSVYASLQDIILLEQEPLLNILSLFTNQSWQIILFPRSKHRPSHYFETGDKEMLISPASVDFGGVFILPREKDFIKITEKDIIDIFNETSISERLFNDLKEFVQKKMEKQLRNIQ